MSEAIAAALYLVSRSRKTDEVVVKVTPGEVERVIDIIQRWPDHFPPGGLQEQQTHFVARAVDRLRVAR